MKDSLLLILLVSVLWLSCGSPEKPKTSDVKQAGNTLLQDGIDKFDPTDIDPNAELVKIMLSASGNTMAEMKFDLDEIKVPVGTTVELNFINKSEDAAMQHNFVLIEDGSEEDVGMAAVKAGPDAEFVPDMYEVLAATKMLGPGEETIYTFRAPEAGKYKFICTYPGHYSMMQGVFIVE